MPELNSVLTASDVAANELRSADILSAVPQACSLQGLGGGRSLAQETTPRVVGICARDGHPPDSRARAPALLSGKGGLSRSNETKYNHKSLMRSLLKSCCLVCLLVPSVLLGATTQTASAPAVDFNRDLRPIFSETCFKCHGPDANKRKGKLRLDTREGAFTDHDGAKAFVPGDLKQSEAWRRINAAGSDDLMPPADSGMKLTPQQIKLFGDWIQQGAHYQEHWSLVPPVTPPLPKIQQTSWPKNSIDSFILARLEQEALKPSPDADKATLLRRLTLDLTGLPPSPEELSAFLADQNSNAYEKAVDRLLQSPHYGERMALEWLDASRFADTHGYHIDSGRDMTRWRKWVIDSFNQNKPFDQFTIEQLAGDLLPNPTVDQKVGSGFNRNHMINFEGGAIPEEYHAAYLIDRVNTTSTVWLGLTVACAQCHDHKYDPITQKDYYQLFAFFNNVPENGLDGNHGNAEPMLRFPTPDQAKSQAQLKAEFAAAEKQVKQLETDLPAAQAAWEQGRAVDFNQPAFASTVPALSQYSLAQLLESPFYQVQIDQLVLAATEPRSLAVDSRLAALQIPAKRRSKPQAEDLRDYFRDRQYPELAKTRETRESAKSALEKLEKTIASTMVMSELETPRETFLLLRGQYDKPGERVTAAVPASLPALPAGAPPNRLGLAQWLVSPSHPLTARVIVNRYWQMYFGTGLVKTAEDFGSQGEWPSHPELLDWLAREFITSGWDVKHMQKLIVMSATYRQSSVTTPELTAKDPENRLLARGPRFRLPAEFIRDQALAVSGLLNPEIGGKSVSPYQPPGIWEELASREDGKNWTAQTYTQSHGPDLYRRTMYTFWKRTSPPPTLATFDAPDRESCTVRRARTDTPLQALVLLNDPTYVEAARKLGERLLTEAKSQKERISLAYLLAMSRTPKPEELQVLQSLHDHQLAVYQADREAALQLLAVGESPRNEQLDPAELAAWTMVASAVLNLDETISKQ
jgi:hypothetical protein